MIQVSMHKGRAALRTADLGGGDWLAYDRFMTEHGGHYDQASGLRSVALEALPVVLSRARTLGLGRAVAASGVAAALRSRAARYTVEITGLDARLAAYQREGVAYLRARLAALLGDDMGLGKTAQLLQAVKAPESARVLVICPALAKAVWVYETRQWAPALTTRTLSGRGSFQWPRPGEAVIVNYDILPDVTDALGEPPAGVVVLIDEIHYCKGRTKRSKAVRRIVRAVRLAQGRTWGATGTPLDNKPDDLYRITEALGIEREWGSWVQFVRLFGGVKTKYGMQWGRPMPEARTTLERIMLRRKKSDVLNLPPVVYAARPVELGKAERIEIERAWTASGVRLQDLKADALAQLATNPHIMTARRLLAAAKLPAVVEWIEECEEAGEPVVLFSAHRAPVDRLASRPGWAVITGDTPPAERARIAEAMQAGRLRGVAGTIRAMGVAITLTRPCLAGFVDHEWTPGANQQARDRLVRIGQKRSVTVYNFIAEHDVDRRVHEILAAKAERQAETVDAITATADSVRAEAMIRLADAFDLERM